ncbi:antibiotic biosynthesis monooxygenase [Archangium lansingense]|uniref:Antibiotic biosynthesis monooxygenase n=1 Tax=Archangium lansingense TaxID=2995310 RepID=A0ABT4A174_9BACT|nr:antibiotic biosynthesis monooxygenase [Archangium lansinium]MCY1075392.1 antibiotic biosynthesis monooxygenase [Archangium lansinium]
MPMQRTFRAPIRQSGAGAINPSLWTLESPAAQQAAAEAVLSAMPASPGLLRLSVFRGLEDLTLFILSQWTDAAARDAFLATNGTPRAAVDEAVPGIRRDWREPSSPYRSFVSRERGEAGCLVVVRQPLLRSDPQAQRDWVDTVMAALEADPHPPAGLLSATFFLSDDGAHAINLAEWTSADAHHAALQRGTDPRAQHGSIGDSPLWRAVRSHPAIRAEHEVRRFQLLGAVEP